LKQAILFDLDNCLAPADQAGPHLLQPVFDAIQRANAGTLPPARLAQARQELWRRPYDVVARQQGFSEPMFRAGWDAYRELEVVGPLAGYDDLAVLGQLGLPCFLVTAGFRRLQESKVDALGIRRLFHAVHIDAIDQGQRRGKQQIFASILSEHALMPAQALVVGDDPESEIRAGNALGIPTVQILRPGVERSPAASRHIVSLAELKPLLAEDRPGGCHFAPGRAH